MKGPYLNVEGHIKWWFRIKNTHLGCLGSNSDSLSGLEQVYQTSAPHSTGLKRKTKWNTSEQGMVHYNSITVTRIVLTQNVIEYQITFYI